MSLSLELPVQRPAVRASAPSGDYQAGLRLLQQQLASERPRLEPLNRALKHFQAELRRNPEHYLACLGCASLLLLADQPAAAREFARRALEIHPQEPDALRLLSLAAEAPPGLAAAQALEWDTAALADELETWALTYTRRLMSQARFNQLLSQPEPGLCQSLLDELDQGLERAETYLALIHQDYESESLRQNLKPLLIYRQRLKNQLEQAALQQAFSQDCDAVLAQIRRFDLQFHRLSEPEARQKLEALLDACDQLADQLDASESQGKDISRMRPLYKQVTRQVEQLQEQLDDLSP